jgi:ArsR family metal-binding transcriptional regulator
MCAGTPAPLIESFDLEVFTPACSPRADRIAARATLNASIADALPYLNATLRGAVFNPGAVALIWQRGEHRIAFHAHEIAIGNVEGSDEALNALRKLIDLVNRTWERRAEVVPEYEVRRRPVPMAIFRHLPQSSCRRCGLPTCFTFALQLTAAQVELPACPVLSEPEWAQHLRELQAMLIDTRSEI